MIPAGRQIVTGPTFTPLPFGLFSVVQDGGNESHWQNGVIHQPDPCGPAGTTIAPCPVVGSLSKGPTATGMPVMGADPFTVYSYVECGPVGHTSSEWESVAMDTLLNGEERAVEATFWTGVVSTTGGPLVMPHLAEDTQVVDSSTGSISQLAASPVTTGTAIDVVEALGALEGNLAACYGGVGVIHIPRAAVAHLAGKGLLIQDGTQLRTHAGNLVAAGSGYPGTAPNGTAPGAGFGWFYATGAVKMYRSIAGLSSNFVQAIDKTENDLVLIAERTYVLTWDCCLFAAQVRLGGFDSGSIGNAD